MKNTIQDVKLRWNVTFDKALSPSSTLMHGSFDLDELDCGSAPEEQAVSPLPSPPRPGKPVKPVRPRPSSPPPFAPPRPGQPNKSFSRVKASDI
jgi:hypothetical protein